MHKINCSEVWGGIESLEEDIQSDGITASLFSLACDGGKGGDIYYFSVCGGDRLTRIAICDVVGHGEQVSQTSSDLYESLRSHMNDPKGSEVLSDMNHVAIKHGIKALTTAAVVSYYIDSNAMSISYAGHPPGWVKRKERGVWQRAEMDCKRPGPANIPLGVLENTHYHQSEIGLSQGDQFVFYTDGILETPDSSRSLFGEDGVADVLNHSCSDASVFDIRRSLVEAAQDHGGGKLTHDDVTLLAFQVN
ncbi:MAG: sigma-B regulation protein RsbU (phosphoserine phosphatase) [Planctomycetota bacterium]|jgi:sigma-B regulation protein RsbU (phosphoserine phosphatase)